MEVLPKLILLTIGLAFVLTATTADAADQRGCHRTEPVSIDADAEFAERVGRAGEKVINRAHAPALSRSVQVDINPGRYKYSDTDL